MIAIPPILFLTAAAGSGLVLGWLYLRRKRKPVLIGLHLLLGAGGLETMIILLRGPPNGDASPTGAFGSVASGLLALAMFSGLTAPLFGKQSRKTANILVATHAGVGIAGFVFFVAWVSNL
jgi:hypothetical protein